MKPSFLIVAICLCLTACIPVELPARQSSRVVSERENSTANEHILHITYDSKIGDATIIATAEQHKYPVIRRTNGMVSVRLPKGSNVNRGINHFKNVRGVRAIDLEKVYRIQ